MAPRRASHFNAVTGKPKVTYATEDVAQLAAYGLQNDLQRPIKAYRCKECWQWHVGTTWPVSRTPDYQHIELGSRVTRCLSDENKRDAGDRMRALRRRVKA